METARFSEMLVSYYITMQYHNPEDFDPNLHHRENLTSYNFKMNLKKKQVAG
jgi:hypothetical protein